MLLLASVSVADLHLPSFQLLCNNHLHLWTWCTVYVEDWLMNANVTTRSRFSTTVLYQGRVLHLTLSWICH